jgi:hypothetical protein
MTDNEIIKAWDILAKLDFFGGQRAGRELWFEKPVDIQDEDIRNFSNDVAFLKDFIDRQNAEIERLNGCVKSEDEVREIMKLQMTSVIREITNEQIDFAVNLSKAEAIKEFAEIIVSDYPEMEYYLNNIVKEMIGEQE